MLEILNKLNTALKDVPPELKVETENIDVDKVKKISDKKNIEILNTQLINNIKKNKKIKIDSTISNSVYLNEIRNKAGLTKNLKKYIELKKGDILLLSAKNKKLDNFYIIFEQHIDEEYFIGVPIDETGKLGSEVSSVYDHTNIEGLLRNNIYGIIGLNEMQISFHKSSISGYAGKIKDISKSKMFNYYEKKNMNSINKLNDKRITPRAKFYETIMVVSEFENKNNNVQEIKDLISA